MYFPAFACVNITLNLLCVCVLSSTFVFASVFLSFMIMWKVLILSAEMVLKFIRQMDVTTHLDFNYFCLFLFWQELSLTHQT